MILGYTDKIQGHKMTNTESKLSIMCESDRAFQRVAKVLNEIGCAREEVLMKPKRKDAAR